MSEISNLRIHFYGVQGSGSIFPSLSERKATQDHMDRELLTRIFSDLERHAGNDGRISASVEEIIGGPPTTKNLLDYRDRFNIPDPPVYGGWTTCVHIETADGKDIVFDCGSGFRVCADNLVRKWEDRDKRDLYIFGSHSHYDHTEGFDQAAVCFDPRNHIHIAANRTYLRALDQNLGIFTHHVDSSHKGVVTPLYYELMPAKFYSCEIRDLNQDPPSGDEDALANSYHHLNSSFQIGETCIQPFEVFHPSPCLAYRVERQGKVFVFCTDHELRRGDDPNDPRQRDSLEAEARLREYSRDADVLYRDGQFLQAEYDGLQGIGSPVGVSRLDWGHSCIEDVIEMAVECRVKSTYIGHHDPNRDWSERNWFDEALRRRGEQSGCRLQLAQAETVINL